MNSAEHINLKQKLLGKQQLKVFPQSKVVESSKEQYLTSLTSVSLPKIFKQPKPEAFTKLVILFKNVYYISKNLNPMLHFESLNDYIEKIYHEQFYQLTQLEIEYNIPMTPDFATKRKQLFDFSEYYRSRRTGNEILRCISDSIEDALIKQCKQSNKFIGICVDDATDEAGDDNMLITMKYFDENNTIQESFLHIEKILT
jgi:hypothetical protein